VTTASSTPDFSCAASSSAAYASSIPAAGTSGVVSHDTKLPASTTRSMSSRALRRFAMSVLQPGPDLPVVLGQPRRGEVLRHGRLRLARAVRVEEAQRRSGQIDEIGRAHV